VVVAFRLYLAFCCVLLFVSLLPYDYSRYNLRTQLFMSFRQSKATSVPVAVQVCGGYKQFDFAGYNKLMGLTVTGIRKILFVTCSITVKYGGMNCYD
jgi:hypothetical protein